MAAQVHSAGIADRDGGVALMQQLFGLYPFLERLFADGGYAGPTFRDGVLAACPRLRIAIVKRPKDAKAFAVLPKRWVVERSFAWLNRCRRLSKDWECLSPRAVTFLLWSSIRLMLRKLCRKG
jgi:transposase